MSSTDSDHEQLEVQQAILHHLSQYLDDQLGDSPSRKKLKKKKVKVRPEEVNSNIVETSNSLSLDVDIGRIKKLASEAKLHSSTKQFKRKRNEVIKEKMKEILSEPHAVKGPNEDIPVASHTDFVDNEEYSDEIDDEFDDDYSSSDMSVEAAIGNDQSQTSTSNKQLDKFKLALGITDRDMQRCRESRVCGSADKREERVETVGSIKGRQREPPSVVVFQERRKRPKVVMKQDGTDSDDSDDLEFNMKKARHDVRRFGVSGLHGVEKEAGMADLLIQLGAKPPTKPCINYKDLQVKQKQDARVAADKREMDRRMGFKVVNPNKKKRSRRDRNDVGGVDGQIGRYKQGVQVVGKKDIASVTQKKHKHK